MTLSPLTIELMMACCRPAFATAWLNHINADDQVIVDSLDWLSEHGLIDGNRRPTARGTAWVAAICATPLPAIPDSQR